jgi:hypothetical protein
VTVVVSETRQQRRRRPWPTKEDTVPGRWESTILLRVTDVAYVRSHPHGDDGRETQELVRCPHCRRSTDWLIAAVAGRVDFACRCGYGWQVSSELAELVAMAEDQPRAAQWRDFDDVRRDLGYRTEPPAAKRKAARAKAHRRSLHRT